MESCDKNKEREDLYYKRFGDEAMTSNTSLFSDDG